MAKILVVEDDRDIRDLLSIRLKGAGHVPVFAPDAITTMTVARKEQPDLIVLDLGLPGGDGYLVMERLHTMPALASLPVIVISARDAKANRDRALEAGAISFLEKPLDMERLLLTITESLGR